MLFRQIAEQISKNRVLKRHLPSQFLSTPFYVTPSSQLKYLKWGKTAFDRELIQVAAQWIQPNDMVWDIGANVGVFSFAAASLARQRAVLAVEPDIWLAHLINKSKALPENRHLSIQVLPMAISNLQHITAFSIVKSSRALNQFSDLKSSSAKRAREEVLVPTTTLDSLLQISAAPNFVKIDVEGAEVLVLEGADKVLTEVRPIIYIEVSPAANQRITEKFRQNNYVLFENINGLRAQKSLACCLFNTIAVPAEKVDFLSGNPIFDAQKN